MLDVVTMRPESSLAVECEKFALEYPKQAVEFAGSALWNRERPLERVLQLGEDEVAAPS